MSKPKKIKASVIQKLVHATRLDLDRMKWSDLMADQQEIQFATDSHDWDEGRKSCLRCGVRSDEFNFTRPRPHCTGNAYICRVARALLTCHEDWADYSNRNRTRPWELGPIGFKLLVKMVVQFVMPMWSGSGITPAVADLMEAISKNPAVCPVLADQLEQDGCTDSALLSALRTP